MDGALKLRKQARKPTEALITGCVHTIAVPTFRFWTLPPARATFRTMPDRLMRNRKPLRLATRKHFWQKWIPSHFRLRNINISRLLMRILTVYIPIFYIALTFGPPLVGCSVKGNISYSSRERIYHVPGQKYYGATYINLIRGERWFCSENNARKVGWRKSKV